MNKTADAASLFNKGFNWAQSILAAYGDKLGIDYETALKIANPFGGGMGKTGESCGVVTGGLMVIGLKYGTTDAKDSAANTRVYELSRRFINEFTARNKTINCRELLGFDVYTRKRLTDDGGRVMFDNCPQYIRDAAEILDKILEE